MTLPVSLAAGLRRLGVAAALAAGVLGGCGRDRDRPEVAPSAEVPPAPTSFGWSDEAAPVPVSSKDPSAGARSALVTVVVFCEIDDTACRALAGKVRAELGERHDEAALRFVWKHAAGVGRGEESSARGADERRRARVEAAHVAAQAVFRLGGSAAFFRFVERASATRDEVKDHVDRAVEAGVERAAFLDEGLRQLDRDKVASDRELAGRLGVRRLPAAFVNGVWVELARESSSGLGAALGRAIERELEAARALQARGLGAEELYVAACRDGYRPDGARTAAPIVLPPPPTATVAGSERSRGPKPPEPATFTPPPGEAPYRGAQNARIVLEVFSDFECPYCARVGATLDELVAAHAGELKIVWRHNPLPMHRHAMLAHEASAEIFAQLGNAAFWRFHDILFAHKSELERADLERYAAEVGASLVRLRAALDAGTHRPRIEADLAAAKAAGVRGVPAFYLAGQLWSGARPLAFFEEMVAGAKAP
ncbi:MAG: thioredoxin domain-containing protein [Myxococcales bacterium]|nr:thioredoxin domain-containing protein [Myxococcales bacterium]